MLAKALSKVAQLPRVYIVSQSDNKLKQCLLGTRRALSVVTQISAKGILTQSGGQIHSDVLLFIT